MKKIYFLVLIMIHTGLSYAQFNPGNFEIRLVSPGGESGVMRVQMRAIASVIPTTSDICGDLSFSLWWNNGLIVDIDAIQSTSIGASINEQSPVPGNSSGAGPPFVGTVAPVGLCGTCGGGFNFPANWVLNQWVNIATVNICSSNDCMPPGFPAGITAADFLIQGFTGLSPNINMNVFDDYTPTNGPLPLNLIAFKANKSGEKDAYLTWTTANEENTSHFVVQRSFDKNSWSDIGTVGAAGYSIDIRNYDLYDANVNSGRTSRLQVYYRLKMYDLDGQTKLSPIQSVVFNNGSTTKVNEFLVYPNPASDGVQVEWSTDNIDQPTLLELYDVTGKLVYQQKVSDNTNQEYIDFKNANIYSGLFLLRIMNGTEPIDHKQIVVGQNR